MDVSLGGSLHRLPTLKYKGSKKYKYSVLTPRDRKKFKFFRVGSPWRCPLEATYIDYLPSNIRGVRSTNIAFLLPEIEKKFKFFRVGSPWWEPLEAAYVGYLHRLPTFKVLTLFYFGE